MPIGNRYIYVPRVYGAAVGGIGDLQRTEAIQNVRQQTRHLGWNVQHDEHGARKLRRQLAHQRLECFDAASRGAYDEDSKRLLQCVFLANALRQRGWAWVK